MEREITEKLLMALQGKLWGYAYKLTWDRDRADDLLQETFIRALCNADSFDGENDKFTKWTYKIMRNAFINIAKKEDRPWLIDEELDEEMGNYCCFHCDDIEVKEIYNAVENLPCKERKVIRLYMVGHKYVEIAADLKIPIGTVKTRISQARIILKEQLKDYMC